MQDRILSFFGMTKSSYINTKQQEKQQKQNNKCRKGFNIIKEQHHQNQKLPNAPTLQFIQVPEQYYDQLFAFKSQRNLYVFPNDLPQGYERCQKLLPYCQNVKTSFIFTSHYTEFLPKTIHINFCQLTNLILIQCKIQSIDMLSFLDAPLLRNLYLDENMITNIKPLIKTKFCLSVLSITNLISHAQNNCVRDFDFTRFHMKENTIGATLTLILHDIFNLESSFFKLFKIQTPLLNISDGSKSLYGKYYRTSKYEKKLEEKFVCVKFVLDGIRTLEELIQSKFEYIYYQKLQKRRDTNLLRHQF